MTEARTETAVTEAPTRWDAFVEASDPGSYLQLSPWAAVKAVNGWQVARVGDDSGPPIGAQVLVRRPRPLPWGFAYAPRGPVAERWDADAIERFTEDARRRLPRRLGRISHLRIDPEIERDGPLDDGGALREALAVAGWRQAAPIQPESTRIIDLRADEAALWGDLRKKWRQYVNTARRVGYRVVDAEGDRLPEFHAIYRETAARAGFLIRTEQAYRDVWEAYRPGGRARLLFAEDDGGRAAGDVVPGPLGAASRGALRRDDHGRRRGPRELPAQVGGDPVLEGARRDELRPVGPRDARDRALQDRVRRPRGPIRRGLGPRPQRAGRGTFEIAQRGRVWIERRRHGLSGSAPSPVAAAD